MWRTGSLCFRRPRRALRPWPDGPSRLPAARLGMRGVAASSEDAATPARLEEHEIERMVRQRVIRDGGRAHKDVGSVVGAGQESAAVDPFPPNSAGTGDRHAAESAVACDAAGGQDRVAGPCRTRTDEDRK